jgi:hypothetical protein
VALPWLWQCGHPDPQGPAAAPRLFYNTAARAWTGLPGTRIEVRHRFYNTAAHRKFLRTVSTELGHASEVFRRLERRAGRVAAADCRRASAS